MEIEGMIIQDLGQFGGTSKAGNAWKKHEWVLETTGQYPRKVKFDVFGDRSETLTFELGKSYVIQVDAESREFNGRWYTDLRAYSARPVENFQQPQQPVTNPYAQTPGAVVSEPVNNGPAFGQTPDFTQGDSQEDLPF